MAVVVLADRDGRMSSNDEKLHPDCLSGITKSIDWQIKMILLFL
jgi:hypothetical protein